MKIKIITFGIGLVYLTSCGSPDSKKNKNTNDRQSAHPADSISEQIEPQDTSDKVPDVAEIHSERRENTLELSDSLKTRAFSSDVNTEGLVKKTGKLRYSGNEPFVFPTLFESDSSSYRLVGDEEFLNDTFRKLNGNTATLYGKIQEIDAQQIMEVHFYKKGKE